MSERRVVLTAAHLLGVGPPDGSPTNTARPTAVAFEGDAIVYVGDDAGAERYLGSGEGAAEHVDARGALVTPGFHDAHVHTVRTGLTLTGLDLTGLTGADGLERSLDALAAYARMYPDAAVICGQGWDETEWSAHRPPTAEEIERAAPDRRVCLTRVDSHSSVISGSLASLVPGLAALAGAESDGLVAREAHHAVRTTVETMISDEDRLAAALHAVRHMAARGIVGFSENAAPHIGPESELDLVRQAAAEVGIRPTLYWGELMAVDAARRLGAAGCAGDLVADGALGSRTAGLASHYTDDPTSCGHLYLTADQVAAHVVACTQAGLQAGFHCIGDAAAHLIADGFRAAAQRVGADRVRDAGHRVEHLEMPSAADVATLADLGIFASVQPVFDELWGGPQGMYSARLGERWVETNPLRDLWQAGVNLAFGSDSPVTEINPWRAIRAAVNHRNVDQRLDFVAAFDAHTVGAARAGGHRDSGLMRPGLRADLVMWRSADDSVDLGPLVADPAALVDLELRAAETICAGRTVHRQA